jgi:tRNA/tmRNA/rRNA uracil-C5-methylase (TrmA/RlmC/RlmD family)
VIKPLKFHSQCFFQNNVVVATKMVQKAKDLLGNKSATLLDLYGGVGTFGINLADQYAHVVILEEDPLAVECAILNAHDVSNVKAFAGDASHALQHVTGIVDVVCDPPRSGMSQKAQQILLEMYPERILYISCNPDQFFKEYRILAKKYELSYVGVFDMFPQTNHVELMVLLVRR